MITCAVVILQLVVPSSATVYTVGDTNGWAMGVDYFTWTCDEMFLVGDSLLRRRAHVDEVSESDYSSFTVSNVITPDSSKATTIPLKTKGTHYFICGAMDHCGSGMKLAITVKSSSSSAGTIPSTSPTGTATPTSATTTPTTATPTTTTTSSYKPDADSMGRMGYFAMVGLVLMAGVLLR